MEEIIKKCNSYDQQVGCCNTFDGKCNKENCQIYNLLQENAELEKENKENLHYLACMTEQRNKLKLTLEEIRMISDNYNLTVNKRREQIANKINEVLQ